MATAAKTPASPPVALTIAGSDNSAGAGAQADLKTFAAHGVYGLTAITSVVAEVPGKVSRIQAVELAVVREQIVLSLEAFPVAAMKTGMLFSAEVIALVAEIYDALPTTEKRPPLVVDPVMVATSGDTLLRPEGIRAYEESLFPLAALVTPNLDEARVLLGDDRPIRDIDALRTAGHALAARYRTAFLMKGGHLRRDPALDLLCLPDGTSAEFSGPFVADVATHGTGCTYAAAVAANLALGQSLKDAVARAKDYVSSTIARHFRWTSQTGEPVDALAHFPL